MASRPLAKSKDVPGRPARIVGLDLLHLPGGDLIEKALVDLERGEETIEALLVSIGAPRLTAGGLQLPLPLADAEHRLYTLLAREGEDSAHSRYNALLRRLTSFESALECVG